MPDLKIFYHLTSLPHWRTIADEQMERIKTSGLLDLPNFQLHINMHYDLTQFESFKEQWKSYSSIVWHESTCSPQDNEHSTFILMQQDAINSETEFYCLYLHQKGITHIGKHDEGNCTKWRRFLDWFNILNWRVMVQKLQEGNWDTVGVNRRHGPSTTCHGNLGFHYSGNSNWYTSSFLKKCKPILQLPSAVNYASQFPHPSEYRHDLEFYAGWNDDRGFSFFNANRELYAYAIEESAYVNFFNKPYDQYQNQPAYRY